MRFKKYIVIILMLIGISCLVFFSLKKREKINVILIVIDALRVDHLGCYGYIRNTSLNIDKFSKEGVLFSHAFSHGSSTWISVPSIFTSLYPSVHKVFKLGAPLVKEFITLPEILQKKGYITAAFVRPQLKTITNFIPERFKSCYIAPVGMHTYDITNKVCNWLKMNYSKQFFLYIHPNVSLHGSQLPYSKIFDKEEEDIKFRNFLKKPLKISNWKESFCAFKSPELDKLLYYMISQYDDNIRYIDDQIKSILEELDKLGLTDNTMVILTSDHGEEFLEHREFFHGTQLYDELIHVPLIMRLPKIIPQGKVVSNLVRHIDIMPTILNILGISSPGFIQGINLMPLIQGKNNLKLDIFSEVRSGRSYLEGIRTEKWKAIQAYDSQNNSYSYELYDLQKDPKELDNLANVNFQTLELLKAKLKNYVSYCKKTRISILGKDYIDKPAFLDAETKGLLRSLGYLQ